MSVKADSIGNKSDLPYFYCAAHVVVSLSKLVTACKISSGKLFQSFVFAHA